MVNSISSSTYSTTYTSNTSNTAQAAIKALLKALQATTSSSSSGTTDAVSNLFDQIDSDGDGNITKSELETSVTKAGGTKQAADALWNKLSSGSSDVTSLNEQQFSQALLQMTASQSSGN